jgi:hypothetical protein
MKGVILGGTAAYVGSKGETLDLCNKNGPCGVITCGFIMAKSGRKGFLRWHRSVTSRKSLSFWAASLGEERGFFYGKSLPPTPPSLIHVCPNLFSEFILILTFRPIHDALAHTLLGMKIRLHDLMIIREVGVLYILLHIPHGFMLKPR